MTMDLDKIKLEAKNEINEEDHRTAIEQEKERIRNKKPLLHIIFPWVIIIKRRK